LNLKPLKKGSIGSDVAIPAALYKIIYDPRLGRVNAYVLPNFDHRNLQNTERDIDYLKRYRVGLGTVEKLTGFTFMTALDDRALRRMGREQGQQTGRRRRPSNRDQIGQWRLDRPFRAQAMARQGQRVV